MDNKELYKTIKDAEDEGYKEGKKVALAEVMSVLDEIDKEINDGKYDSLLKDSLKEEIKRRLEGVK